MCSLPSRAQPIALPKLGSFRIGHISRENPVIAHALYFLIMKLTFNFFEGLLPSIHPVCSLPSWAQPIALPKLGNFRIGHISRENPVIAHLEGEEARKLEDLDSSEAIFLRGKRDSWGFNDSRADLAQDTI